MKLPQHSDPNPLDPAVAAALDACTDPAELGALCEAFGVPTRERIGGGDTFQWHSSAALSLPAPRLMWHAKGLLAKDTHGMAAGELKSLKSTITTIAIVGMAAGLPVLGHFEVDEPQRVACVVGEGGEVPNRRLLQRVARAYGTQLADLPILTTYDRAAISSDKFAASLKEMIDRFGPDIILLDPLYAYHGTSTDSRSLYEEGDLLGGLQEVATAGGASLLVVNHFNQTGSSKGLKRITMAGGGEWVDSWILLWHRNPPNVEEGSFRLRMDVGSRQWGGRAWDVNIELGAFDDDLGTHDGDIRWEVFPASDADADNPTAQLDAQVLQIVKDEPWTHTRTGLRNALGGGGTETKLAAIDRLLRAGRIVEESVERIEGRSTRTRDLLALAGTPVPLTRTGQDWSEENA